MKTIFHEDFAAFLDKVLKEHPPNISCANNAEFACCRLLDDIVNDFYVRCPARRLATALRTNENMSDIYFFNFDQPISCPNLTKLGAFHTSDITWVFGAEGSYYESREVPNCSWTPNERQFSSNIIARWQNFATNYNPSPSDWFSYDRPHYYYHNLAEGNGFYLGENVRPDSWCNFWDDIDVTYAKKFFPEDTPTQSSETHENTNTMTGKDPIPPGNMEMTAWVFFTAVGIVFLLGCACSWCISGVIGCCKVGKVDIQYTLTVDDESAE